MTANEKLFIVRKLVIMTGRLCKPGIRQGKLHKRNMNFLKKLRVAHLCPLVDHLLEQRKKVA